MDNAPQSAYNVPLRPLKPYAAEQKRLFAIACFFGIGMLLYVMGNNVISLLITSDPQLYNRYLNDKTFSVIFGMVNTTFCVFAPFALIYWLMRRKKYIAELPLGGVYDPVNAVLLTFMGLGSCYIANIVTGFLSIVTSAFGIESYTAVRQAESLTTDTSPFALVLQLFGFAILPALFEEFAFRGVVLQSLRRYGDGFAILVSAALFGLLHGNLVQVPFAFMVGIVLGYCTVVSGSMWVGIAIHFCNNLISVLQTVMMTVYGETATLLIMNVMIYVLIIIGLACFVAYAMRNRAFAKLPPSRFRYMPHKGAMVLLAPSVLFSCCYFLYAMLMDIVGFYDWFADGIANLVRSSVIV